MKKYALVTGGSRGIGRAVCLKLASMGYSILVNYNSNSAAADETIRLVSKAGSDGEALQFDVSDKAQVESTLNGWFESHPDAVLEVLVNNAGITKDALMVWMSDEEWNDVLNISLHGFYNVTRTLLERFLRNKYGRIINLVSLSGLKGTPGQVNYSSAKGAVIGATKALAQEVAKRKITVNAVAPGFIKTDMTGELNEKELKRLIPANRFGTAEEVADVVGFLASPGASYITGEVINVNGGMYS